MGILDQGMAVVGSTTIDKVVSQRRSVTKIGGVTAYAGITYSRLGIATFVVSNIACRDREIIERLEKENIVVLNGRTRLTTHFINDIRQDSRRQQLFNRARSIQPHQLAALIKRVGGLHLGPLHPGDLESDAMSALSGTDLKIFLDVQGYTRKVMFNRVNAAVSKHLTSALKAAQIIKANRAELKLILEYYQKSLTEIMNCFEIEETVITFGQDGGRVETLSGHKYDYEADRVETVSDPTGAGDVFFAAYLVARFADDMDIEDACRCAARIAARQVAGRHISMDRLGWK